MKRFGLFLCAITYVFGFPSNLSSNKFGQRIIGGSNASPGQFPYVAEIYLANDGKHQCGAVIINDRWVLTAAQCVPGFQIQKYQLKVGTNTLNSGGDTYTIDKIIVHRDYSQITKQNDLALIHTASAIEFKDTVQSIPLADYDLSENEDVTVAGWGYTSWESFSEYSTNLQYINLKTITRANCAIKLIWDNIVTDNQVCTLTKNGQGICGGDAGGPLVHDGKLVGVASWSVPCGTGLPDVYAKISAYLKWIKYIID